MEQKGIRTNCKFCGQQCALLVDLDGSGNVEKIRPDSSEGTVWCATGRNGLNLMNHQERVRMPLKRTGGRGENQWKEISWEEAFEEIGRRFKDAVDTYGPNTFLGIRGFNKPYFNMIYERFMNTIGTVNSMGAANMCHAASMNAAKETFGFMLNPRITKDTKFVVLWGANPYNTNKALAASIQKACANGAKLIVVDPCNTQHAKKADIWIPLKPGTDIFLALGMVNLIIRRKWYDEAYIEKCTYGFEKLKDHVKDYSLEKTAEITGVSEEVIEAAAKMTALGGPGVFEVGNAMDHNLDGFQKSRAVDILMAVTGNVDKEGAAVARGMMSAKQVQQRKQITRSELCPYNDPEKRKQIIGYQDHFLDNFNESSGKALADTLNTGKPYPIKVLYVQGGNPAMIWENREELVKAFCKLDFMVVSDFFITPTAMLADIILPAAVYMEYESVRVDGKDSIYYCPNFVPDATAKSDLEIINEMAKAMGYKEEFWDTMDDFWNTYLEPFGITIEEVREKKVIESEEKPKSVVCGKYRENGFPTKSGKINLYSDKMEEKGNAPLPVYCEYNKVSSQYPYLSTNYKSEHFYHTAGRQIQEQREKEPNPIAFVSSDIAKERDLNDGDWILVATEAGEVRQEVRIDDKMASGTVALAHGWWYPEKEKNPFRLEACSNNIVFDDRYIGKELPAFTTRGLPCEVTKIGK